MRHDTRELRCEEEGWWHGHTPAVCHFRGRDAVERRIDLDETEHLAVAMEEIGLRGVSRIERPDPEVVRIPDAADPKLHDLRTSGGLMALARDSGIHDA